MGVPSAGGALLPNQDQKLTGNLSVTGNITATGTITGAGNSSTTLTSPAITGTVTGAASYTTPTLTTPVIATGMTASGSASNDFSGSTGTFKTSSGANQLSGAVSVTDATTPSVTTATGKTNTGFVTVLGKTSGGLKVTTADATAQTVTVTAAAQTSGASTLTIPDQAGVSSSFVFTTLAQTLTNKTLTAPVLGVATGTSLAVTGLVTSSSPSAGMGYATGAGSTVAQSGSRTTGVTINAVTGAITLVSAAGSATAASFVVTNSAVAATDVIIVNQKSGTDKYEIFVTAIGAGSFTITSFTTGGTTTETPVFNFAVLKGVAA